MTTREGTGEEGKAYKSKPTGGELFHTGEVYL